MSTDPQYRTATPADIEQMALLDGAAFGFSYSPQDLNDAQTILDLGRFVLATSGADIVGIAGDYPFTMTVPGGSLPVPGVTWVSVAATHRRRGILRGLMRYQLRALAAQGYAAAVLTASEGGIYSRFGYGPATVARRVIIDRRRAKIVARDSDGPSQVRLVQAAEARSAVEGIHDRWRVQVPGALSRTSAWWDLVFLEREHQRDGMSALFCLVHPDGYLLYRLRSDWNDGLPRHVCVISEYAAATPVAHRQLWQVALGMDLVGSIETLQLPVDDPLPYLLADARQVRTVGQNDGLWIRPIDVAALLAARNYGVEVDAVIEVLDPADPGETSVAGRYHLTGGPQGADCRRTDAEPDLVLASDVLGSVYLGGHRLRSFAAAGQAAGSEAMLTRLDRALQAERAPIHGTNF